MRCLQPAAATHCCDACQLSIVSTFKSNHFATNTYIHTYMYTSISVCMCIRAAKSLVATTKLHCKHGHEKNCKKDKEEEENQRKKRKNEKNCASNSQRHLADEHQTTF